MKIMKIKRLLIAGLMAVLLIGCAGCGYSEAEKVNRNISEQARYFECERRVTVYNARTDKVIMYIEGYINIENNLHSELVVTAKVGIDQYKKTMFTSTIIRFMW